MRIFVIFSALYLALSLPVLANQTEMTFEEYEIALAGAQEREKTARELIAAEQAKIEALNLRLIDLDRLIALAIREKYDILGITDQDIVDAENEISSIRFEIESLSGLVPDELLKHLFEINSLGTRIDVLKNKPVCRLWRIKNQIPGLQASFDRLKSMLPDKQMAYTVREIPGKRDCLWRIAGYDFVYADPLQWPRIYRANKNLLDDGYQKYVNETSVSRYSKAEDLIFPGQKFDIPR
jgi:nucleoid-associated protein YgaU